MTIKKIAPPTVLVILDGFGHSKETTYNAIAQAHTPTLNMLAKHYPHTTLQASRNAVGLPNGYMGNSEVGHLTIGAGRIIPQSFEIINKAIQDTTFYSNPELTTFLQDCQKKHKTLHLIGLLSDAGVHSHTDHLYAFLQAAEQYSIKHIVIHAFLDGRDTPPQSAKLYLQKLQTYIDEHPNVQLGSIHGRYYAMDRDKNWKRTEESFNTLTKPQTDNFNAWKEALNHYYDSTITDEFIPPTQLNTTAQIQPDDFVIVFNFRPDRTRQIISQLSTLPNVSILTPVHLGNFNSTITCMFQEPLVTNTLKEIIDHHKKTIFSIAETEKYAHVTYFFNGGKEGILPNETRILIPSIPAQTYVEYPEMSAAGITKAVIQSLHKAPCDFYVINYANADMVGHSGNLQATIKAIECLDQQIKQLYEIVVTQLHGTLIITADHGNAEEMYDSATKQPKTSHTTNSVPCMVINEKSYNSLEPLQLQGLQDIAPYILQIMNIPVPSEMKRD